MALSIRWASRAFLTESRLLWISSSGTRRTSLMEWPGPRNDRNKVIYLPDISVCKTNLRGLKKKSEYNYKTTVTYTGFEIQHNRK